LDPQGLPTANQMYVIPEAFKSNPSNYHNRGLYSMWAHFVEFCIHNSIFYNKKYRDISSEPFFLVSAYRENPHIPNAKRLDIFVRLSMGKSFSSSSAASPSPSFYSSLTSSFAMSGSGANRMNSSSSTIMNKEPVINALMEKSQQKQHQQQLQSRSIPSSFSLLAVSDSTFPSTKLNSSAVAFSPSGTSSASPSVVSYSSFGNQRQQLKKGFLSSFSSDTPPASSSSSSPCISFSVWNDQSSLSEAEPLSTYERKEERKAENPAGFFNEQRTHEEEGMEVSKQIEPLAVGLGEEELETEEEEEARDLFPASFGATTSSRVDDKGRKKENEERERVKGREGGGRTTWSPNPSPISVVHQHPSSAASFLSSFSFDNTEQHHSKVNDFPQKDQEEVSSFLSINPRSIKMTKSAKNDDSVFDEVLDSLTSFTTRSALAERDGKDEDSVDWFNRLTFGNNVRDDF
jgi:hypothetical protein